MKKTKITRNQNDEIISATPERVAQYGNERRATFRNENNRAIERFNTVEALSQTDMIGEAAYQAALQYASDYYVGIEPHNQGTDYSSTRVDGGGNADFIQSKKLDAGKRFTAARDYVLRCNPVYVEALRCMVLDDASPTAFAVNVLQKNRAAKNLADTGKKILIKSLNCLSGFYEPPTRKTRRNYSSMVDGARPKIHPFQKVDEAA